jgi:hypothetical protein
MIVFAGSIWLDCTTQFSDIFSQITLWLFKKTGDNIFPDTFINVQTRIFSNGETLEVYKTDKTYPQIFCFRFIERDQGVSGRQWITEIGLKQESQTSDIQCSFLVQTLEISPIVSQPTLTTRPKLIPIFLEKFQVTKKTCSLQIIELVELSDADLLSYEIDLDKDSRDYPIILISPNEDGEYLIDIDKLFYQVKGLAKIVKILPTVDSYKATDILGKQYSAYNGAINIIFPKLRKGSQTFIPTYLLLPEYIQTVSNTGGRIDLEILTSIAHRMNLSNYWKHISPEMVKAAQKKREIEQLRSKIIASGKQEEYVKLLEEIIKDNENKIEDLHKEINKIRYENDYYIQEYEKAEEDKKNFQNKSIALDSQLESLKLSRNKKGYLEDCSDELRVLLGKFYDSTITPSECLDFFSRLYPDRLIILDSAHKSAKASQGFKDKRKVFDLIWKLCNEYWESLNEGIGDTTARQIFGDDFAAKESDGVESKKIARKRRTFSYDGRDIEMMKHLRIGVNENAIDTIRIHFEWLNDEKKIIIGHCGPHLDSD